MPLPVPLRRIAYRVAYTLLRCYWFVARPVGDGVKCVLRDGEQILLVRHTYGRRSWQFPGGTVKRSEPPQIAARREIREELGLDIDSWTPLATIAGRAHYRRDSVHCFQAEVRDPALTVDRGEIAAVGWFERTALPDDLGDYVEVILGLVAP
jgi:8-oxo-dGTP pyrophosphatase MutT (NUDIX family)